MDKFAIHRAAEEGDKKRVRKLLEEGVSVDGRDDMGRTPLHCAAEKGHYEVAELLISSKCDINLKDRSGYTPLLLASMAYKKRVVDLLLQRGAQINCANICKYTLLHDASQNGWTDLVRLILDNGEADPNAATGCGDTPLMFAARRGHKAVAVLLIRAGADVNRSDGQKKTALHLAACYGFPEVVKVLLEEEGLDLNPQDEDLITPLYEACYWGHREVVKQLLVAGADTSIRNNGETALSVGIRQEELTLKEIRLFVQHGASFEDCDYLRMSHNSYLKENILKDVDLVTQSITNKLHKQPEKLPSIDVFKLDSNITIQDKSNYFGGGRLLEPGWT